MARTLIRVESQVDHFFRFGGHRVFAILNGRRLEERFGLMPVFSNATVFLREDQFRDLDEYPDKEVTPEKMTELYPRYASLIASLFPESSPSSTDQVWLPESAGVLLKE